MAVKHKLEGKFEFVYLKDVVVYYSSVLEPKLKYQSNTEKEFCVTAFVSDEDRAVLEDKILVNKSFYKVGVDKNKKRVIKFPVDKFKDVEGLNGVTLTLNAHRKNGQPNSLIVIDDKGQPMTELVGNGSRVNLKLFGYRNGEGFLVLSLNTVMVTDLVPYEGGVGGYDEELGVVLPAPTAPKPTVAPAVAEFENDDNPFDDDVPF